MIIATLLSLLVQSDRRASASAAVRVKKTEYVHHLSAESVFGQVGTCLQGLGALHGEEGLQREKTHRAHVSVGVSVPRLCAALLILESHVSSTRASRTQHMQLLLYFFVIA